MVSILVVLVLIEDGAILRELLKEQQRVWKAFHSFRISLRSAWFTFCLKSKFTSVCLVLFQPICSLYAGKMVSRAY